MGPASPPPYGRSAFQPQTGSRSGQIRFPWLTGPELDTAVSATIRFQGLLAVANSAESFERTAGVSTEYVPTREDRFSFGIWTVGWQGVDVFGSAMRPPMPAETGPVVTTATTNLFSHPVFNQLREPVLAPGETWRDVQHATAGPGTLGRRGLACEHLDQLALEQLYGVR
jgi:hypothetical protein